MTAGATSAAPPARSPIRWSRILGRPRSPTPRWRPLSSVTRVLTNAQGNKVIGVEYYDSKKERQVQEASVVVLAAWSAQNPRLLFNSATDKHPKGLANSSGLVGKYMMAHFSSGTWALFDDDVQNYMGTTGSQFMSYDRYGKDQPERRLRQLVHRRGHCAQDERPRAGSPTPASTCSVLISPPS